MQHKLDIIGFGEFLADDYEELKKLLNDYPYSYHTNRFCVQRYECELGLYSKYPWDAVHEHKLPSGDIALEMQFTHHEQNISLFMTHPHAPFSQKNLSARNSQLEALSTLVRSSTAQHVLIMGDFNVTPWSRSYTNFLDSTAKLRDTAQGHLNARTWGISSARLLHLDHIFITKHTKSSPLHIEGTYGSDHNLIWTQLYL
jgi:endonuclease/exonuclease/phosphatase family metal-dependent hydrolase